MTGHYDYVDSPEASHLPLEHSVRVKADHHIAH
jgi:hypothetical protein